jgi:hypothetical protein
MVHASIAPLAKRGRRHRGRHDARNLLPDAGRRMAARSEKPRSSFNLSDVERSPGPGFGGIWSEELNCLACA